MLCCLFLLGTAVIYVPTILTLDLHQLIVKLLVRRDHAQFIFISYVSACIQCSRNCYWLSYTLEECMLNVLILSNYTLYMFNGGKRERERILHSFSTNFWISLGCIYFLNKILYTEWGQEVVHLFICSTFAEV